MKLKRPASQKIKRRYLSIKGKREQVEQSVIEGIGTLGWAKAVPFFVRSVSDWCILAVSRDMVTAVRASLALSPHNLIVTRVSGTIKGLGKTYHSDPQNFK